MDDFIDNQRGIIRKIELFNFMVYEHIEYEPEPYINMIVGPNGSGKSSVVCGIILGLGGKPKTIGRTALLKDYINREKGDKAKIVIELSNPDGVNYVVQREFNNMNKNTWHLNGRTVSQKEIDDLMTMLNIQVDNLCQFLPQDKVKDFAKMNPQELLENTVKTVGSNELMVWHSSLVDLRTNEGELKKKIMDKKNVLEKETLKLSSLENDVKFVQERRKYLEQLDLMNQKKEWTVYKEKKDEVKEIMDEKEKLSEIKNSVEKEIKPFKLEVKKAEDTLCSIDQQLVERMGTIAPSINKIHRNMTEMNRLEENINKIKMDESEALAEIKTKERDISKLKHAISCFESTSVDLAEEKDLEEKLQNFNREQNETVDEVNKLHTAEYDAKHEIRANENSWKRIDQKLKNVNNLATEKLNHFRRLHPDASELMIWLEENRDKFKGHVYNPIQLEINVKADFAKYVEHLLPQRDLSAFVCEFNDDVSTLLHYGRTVKKLKINAISAQNCAHDKYQPTINISDLRAYDFQCYVAENIEGPQPILNYLCKTYGIHNIPIGTAATEAMVDSVPRNIYSFFTAHNHHSIRTSKYSGERLSRVNRVRDQVRIFTNTLDMSLVEELKLQNQFELQKLCDSKEKLKGINTQLQAVEKILEQMKTEKKNIQMKLGEIKSSRSNLIMKKKELQKLYESTVDPETHKKEAKQKLLKTIVRMGELQKVNLNTFVEYQGNLIKTKVLKLKKIVCQDILKITQSKLAEHSANYEEAKQDLKQKENELEAARRELIRAFEVARHTTGGLKLEDSAFKEKFQSKFQELPETVVELEESMEAVKGHLACLGTEEKQNVMVDYEKQKRLVESLNAELESPGLNLQSLLQNIAQIKLMWMTGLTCLIAQINEKFSLFFSIMNCVGEISLHQPKCENDYQEYGITIKVKFRGDEQLVALGPFQQSGGERAVSIAVYMLALQHLTQVPFRCVDEINQGMDEKNERTVYKLLMETTETSAATQCFLLTPKMLSSFDYSDKVSVCCVHQGNLVCLNKSKYALISQIFISRNSGTSLKRKHGDSPHETRRKKIITNKS